jgi:hypothetical protein
MPGCDGTPGWADFKGEPMAIGAAELYYWSMLPADLDRVPAVRPATPVRPWGPYYR